MAPILPQLLHRRGIGGHSLYAANEARASLRSWVTSGSLLGRGNRLIDAMRGLCLILVWRDEAGQMAPVCHQVHCCIMSGALLHYAREIISPEAS